jgi:DNA-binding transcriptional LysR family regulator
VECTLSGQKLLPLAQSLIARVEDIACLMREQDGSGGGVVRFGASGVVVAHVLTAVLTKFRIAHPTIDVDLVEGEDVELEEGVLRGELDCAVITSWGSSRAAAKHLLTEEIVLVVPPNHPLVGKQAVTLGMIASESMLLPPPGMNMFAVVTDALRRAGIEPKLGPPSGYPELTWNLVRMGLGVAPVPKMLVFPRAPEGLVVIPFQEELVRELHVVYSWDRPLSPGARALVIHVQGQVFPIRAKYAKAGGPSDRSRRLRYMIGGPPQSGS